jgi:hypothetical protein
MSEETAFPGAEEAFQLQADWVALLGLHPLHDSCLEFLLIMCLTSGPNFWVHYFKTEKSFPDIKFV